MNSYEKWQLARDESASPKVLEKLSKTNDWDIRYWVAANPSAPERGLIRLSKDRYLGVRYNAIRNKNAGGILKKIVRAILGENGKIDWWGFGNNRIQNNLKLGFLKNWEERYFHGL